MKYPSEAACHFVGVGGVVIYNNRVLLVKLNYGPAKGKWLIPGGMVDCGETLKEAIRREIHEETNQEIVPKEIIGLRSMVRKSDGITDVYCIFNCELVDKPQPLIEDKIEIKEVQWLPISSLEDNEEVSDYTKYLIKRLLTKEEKLLFDKKWTDKVQQSGRFLKYEHFF
ncbi:MAG: NUDIX domain-containing protein [Candidatus Hodarchaeales archaeon]